MIAAMFAIGLIFGLAIGFFAIAILMVATSGDE